jgi:putative transposase
MYIVVVLDWYTKKITRYYASSECKSRHWLKALDMAVNRQFSDGVRQKQLFLMSDNGGQPTSIGSMQACREMDIKQVFTSYNNPEGNADTVALKSGKVRLKLADDLGAWIPYCSGKYLHSSLEYKSPEKYEEEYQNSYFILLAAA